MPESREEGSNPGQSALPGPTERPGSEVQTPPSVLSPAQSMALQRAAADYKAAQAQVMEAVGVLWNAQIDMAIVSDDADLVTRTMRRPLGLWDDCDCGCGSGTLSW